MYKDILLPVDLNDEKSWSKALPTALALCKTFGSRLHVVTVVPGFGLSGISQYFPEGTEEKILEETAERLRQFIAEHVPDEIPTQDIVAEGSIHREILAMATKIEADLIIMTSHEPAIQDYLIAPNAAHVVNHASISVMVVRGST